MSSGVRINYFRMGQMFIGVMATITLSLGICVANFEIPDSRHPYCRRGACGKISYGEMQNMYQGLFYTQDEMTKKIAQEAENRKDVLKNEGVVTTDEPLPGDGDACCATEKYHTVNYTMVNLVGQTQYIVHMPDNDPPRYQLVPNGKCVLNYGNCIGKCVMEPIYITLLVYDLNSSVSPPLAFDTFEVPGYCSCKNVFNGAKPSE